MHIFISPKSDRIRSILRFCQGFLIILFFLTMTCVNSGAKSVVTAIFNTALPPPGWKAAEQTYHYTPANLYEYINGAAEFFIAYGFKELTGASYGPVSGSSDSVTLDIYDMGSSLNAFGVFQSRKNSQEPSLNYGAAATGSNDYIAFIKDRFYVEIQSYINNASAKNTVSQVAATVAKQLPGDNNLPRELLYFPKKGRIAGSERYIKGGILGYAFLDQGLVCEYQIAGSKAKAFIAMMPSDQAAAEALKQHRSLLEKSGVKYMPLEGLGEHAFISEEPYHNKIVATQLGTFVIGIYDLDAVEEGQKLLADIVKNIKTLNVQNTR